MRYEIKAGKVVESLSIDAPYDNESDAQEDLNNNNVYENTSKGSFIPVIALDSN